MFKKTGQKFAYEVLVPTIKKNLTRRRSEFDKVVKGTDDALKGLSKEQKVDVKSKGGIKKTVNKIGKIIDDAEKKGLDMTEKKAKGGRVGLKRGTGLMSRKSNIQKIKETFGPKQKPQSRMTGKKKKFPDMSGDGKVTKKDILIARGVIPKPKKRII
tara:strand:- start:122 stop:592 length:471 start_codon:yes stop_codon:yes gene_type:complete